MARLLRPLEAAIGRINVSLVLDTPDTPAFSNGGAKLDAQFQSAEAVAHALHSLGLNASMACRMNDSISIQHALSTRAAELYMDKQIKAPRGRYSEGFRKRRMRLNIANWQKLSTCYSELLRHEHHHQKEYAYVLRIREDGIPLALVDINALVSAATLPTPGPVVVTSICEGAMTLLFDCIVCLCDVSHF